MKLDVSQGFVCGLSLTFRDQYVHDKVFILLTKNTFRSLSDFLSSSRLIHLYV